MMVLSEKDFINLNTENVIAIYISRGKCIAVADIEVWQGCPYNEDSYRIELFDKCRLNQEWILDDDIIKSKGFIYAVTDRAGYMCGGKSFCHEVERDEDKNVYEAFLDFLRNEYGEDIRIFQAEVYELAKMYPWFRDGLYVFVEEGMLI